MLLGLEVGPLPDELLDLVEDDVVVEPEVVDDGRVAVGLGPQLLRPRVLRVVVVPLEQDVPVDLQLLQPGQDSSLCI